MADQPSPKSFESGFVPGRHIIDTYGNGGFRFAEMSHRGSILALPSSVRAIDVRTHADIEASLIDLALTESGGLDVLIIGSGKDLLPLAAPLRARLRDAGVGCEPMATAAAAETRPQRRRAMDRGMISRHDRAPGWILGRSLKPVDRSPIRALGNDCAAAESITSAGDLPGSRSSGIG